MTRATPMAADGAYNRNSRIQSTGLLAGAELLRAAAAVVELPDPGQPVTIADYGCSGGGNSLIPVGAAVDGLRARTDQPITVAHTDLPDNDFATLFDTLWNDPGSYASRSGVYPVAIGRSFYRQVLPPASVTLGWSSWSVAWLSRSPMPVPDHIHVSYSADPATRSAFAGQAAREWEDFLAARAAELRHGARLVLVVPAADDDGTAGYRPMFDAAWAVLLECLREGLISREEAAGMGMPHVGRSAAELAAPFGDGSFSGLAIERLQTFTSADPFWDDFQSNRDAEAFGAGWAGVFAAGAIPSLMTGLDGGPDDPRAARIADRLRAGVADRLASAPEQLRIPVANLVLTKEDGR